MSATATARLRLIKQAYNSNPESWGGELNQGALDMVDEAFATLEKTVSGSVTLSTNNYITDEARSFCLVLTGTGGTLTVPATDKPYLVVNNCSGDVTVTPSGGTGAVVRAGTAALWYSDATDGFVVDPTLDQIRTAAADVAMGGFKITGLANGTLGSQDAAPVAQVESLIANASVAVPVQTGQANKVLTTDGTSTLSWEFVDTANMADEAVTNGKLAHMAQATLKGRAAGAGTGDATDLTASQVGAIVFPSVEQDIIPDADSTRDLGSSSRAWAEAYLDKVLTDTISNLANTKSVGIDYVVEGTAKAWAVLSLSGTPAVADSFNLSSLTDNAVGDWSHNFTNNMFSSSYTASGFSGTGTVADQSTLVVPQGFAVSSARFRANVGSTGVGVDRSVNTNIIFGDLA